MDNVKEKITVCAFEKFVEKGIPATAVDELSRCANVSKGLVYYYFRNKRDILSSVLDMLGLPFSKLEAEEFEELSLSDFLYKMLKVYLEYYITIQSICQQPLYKIQRFFYEAINELEDYKNKLRDNYDLVVEKLKIKVINKYNLSESDARMYSIFLFTQIDGIIKYMTFFPEEDWKEVLKKAKFIFDREKFSSDAAAV